MIEVRSKNIFLSDLSVAGISSLHLPSNQFDLGSNEFARVSLIKIRFSDTGLPAMYLRTNFTLTNFENLAGDPRVHHTNAIAEVDGSGFEDHQSVFGSSIGNRILDRIELQLTKPDGTAVAADSTATYDVVLRWSVIRH